MAINEALNQRIRKVLSPLTPFEEKKMFRGVAFMVNDKMLVSAGDSEFMFRFDPKADPSFLDKYAPRPMEMKGRVYKGYFYIQESKLDDSQLTALLEMSLKYLKTLKD